MGSKHSAGPWSFDVVGTSSAGDDGENVCEVTNGYKRIAEHVSEADAPLIAAAPELLTALKAVRHEVGGTHPFSIHSNLPPEIVERIDAAIAKATGSAA